MVRSSSSGITSTNYERRSLERVINLSDGHTRQPLTVSQAKIVARFPVLFAEGQERPQSELEEEFVDAFLHLAGQGKHYPLQRYFLSYSASSAIEMLASYFRRHGESVALIEPAFDNIPNILRREGVPLQVVPEEWLSSNADMRYRLAQISADVVWLVTPNNPTGRFLNESAFVDLVSSCAELGKTLVCDFCFRFFCRDMRTWDQYAILKQSGIRFVTIEDTGKTWSTLDMKLGLVVCSDHVATEMYSMHDDLLLNISPFHLRVLTEFVQDTLRTGLDATILYHVDHNRAVLRHALAGSVLEPATAADNSVPLEWIRICADVTGEDLWEALCSRGIHILPGSNFYWCHRDRGSKFLRIPLSRAPDIISHAAPIIREVATQLSYRPSSG